MIDDFRKNALRESESEGKIFWNISEKPYRGSGKAGRLSNS